LSIQNSISGSVDIQLMQTQLFWIPDSKSTNAPNFSQKRCHMREIWVFKDDNWILPAIRFREETNPNCIPKHQNRHPSFNFSNLAPQVNQSRRSRKAATNLKPPTSNHQPQTSCQPPATSHQLPSHYHHLLMFTLELWFFLLTICV
jgi:hypothetical protein